MRLTKDDVVPFVMIVALAVLSQVFLFRLSLTSGRSMESAVHDGDILLLVKPVEVRRGDIVAIEGNDQHLTLIKRVIGMPGETVEFGKDCVYVDGELLDEPYLDYPGTYFRLKYKVPEDSYFVLGDNRDNSGDSRLYGSMPAGSIIGVAKLNFSDYGLGRAGVVVVLTAVLAVVEGLCMVAWGIVKRIWRRLRGIGYAG